jgi:carbon-monoxide dehydrogenase medium subunit
LKYLRPKSIDEARRLLASGVALGGGTTLAPRRRNLTAVVDLQDLGLSDLQASRGTLTVGASCTLQQLVEAEGMVPPELADVCRQEAAWNLRNMATIAGAALASDGRSPLAAALLAIGARVVLAGGGGSVLLDELLDRRPLSPGTLVTALLWKTAARLRYEQVARTPADRPIVAALIGRPEAKTVRVVLAGFGHRPIRVRKAERALAAGDVAAAARAASTAYEKAGDHLASAAYRSHVAGVLVRRLAAGEGPAEARGR